MLEGLTLPDAHGLLPETAFLPGKAPSASFGEQMGAMGIRVQQRRKKQEAA